MTLTRGYAPPEQKQLADADSVLPGAQQIARVLISYPKSGRTWFRFIFDLAGLEVRMTHAGYSRWQPKKQTRLVFTEEAEADRIVFLHRNPIDTAVSMYFQRVHRTHRPMSWRWLKTAARGLRPPNDMDAFLRHPGYGVERICKFNRAWLDYLAPNEAALTVRYEEMIANPMTTLRRVMNHYDYAGSANTAWLVDHSTFEQMQAVEDKGGQRSESLRLGQVDKNDPDSRKVRRGKVGGYRDYLSLDDQLYFEAVCRRYGVEFPKPGAAGSESLGGGNAAA